MAFEQQLRVPGPTPLPERVVRAAGRPMINHRGPDAAVMIRDLVDGLRWGLQTENDILLFPASGTGGLEAAVANLFSPGEPGLFCSIGSFGDRWAEIAATYGVDVVRLEVPWGEALDPEDVDRVLAEHPEIQKVCVTHNETSTGVVNDMRAIAAVVKGRDRLLAVDSVSGAGVMPLPVDELGLDVVVTASQKGWMAPPGLAMIAVNQAGYAAAAEARCPSFYWDFARQKGFIDQGTTFTTPPLSVMYALQEGLAMLREEGLENVFARHRRIADMIRAGLTAAGLRLVAPETHRSDAVTAVHSPASSPEDLKRLLADLRVRHGLVLAGGQGKLAGRVFRVGHLGYIEERDAYSILATIEQALADHGLLSRVGLTVAAAQRVARGTEAAPEPAGAGR
ncbi:MAG TPA: alanine--glyoxylate aminotransferase family protein [Candidatus Dormibacteraeota bacterium]|jgi:aspartate aminotransferase-like enzyme|nr:alanine--glyoxylate aminotransferase family protein [Candidatus Dormibacteraeota bacterium]